MTQPGSPAFVQTGIWVKLPPRREPARTTTLPPRMIASTRRLRSSGVGVDEMFEQHDEHRRTLRVPEEDDRSAVVEVRQVVLEAGTNAVVCDHARRRAGSRDAEEPVQGDLAVHRGPDAAHGGKARRLGDGRLALRRLDLQVGVHGRLRADRRIDVEAVEFGRRVHLRVQHRRRARRLYDGRGEAGGARVVRHLGPAEPYRT